MTDEWQKMYPAPANRAVGIVSSLAQTDAAKMTILQFLPPEIIPGINEIDTKELTTPCKNQLTWEPAGCRRVGIP